MQVSTEIILAKYIPKISRRQQKIKKGMKREPLTVLFLHNPFYFTSCKLSFFLNFCSAVLVHLTVRKKKKKKSRRFTGFLYEIKMLKLKLFNAERS